ncbi:hypothetical protein LCGC14_2547030 [marine sediment metagenome]|uniref:Uncharacterized protein n=1 Tax=marine sediment metagenome TaxID=412755 RepID=A0A0F9D0G5_9ZZZZ
MDKCKWTMDNEYIYVTACGHTFYFTDELLSEQSGFVWCPYCGKAIEPVEQLEESE